MKYQYHKHKSQLIDQLTCPNLIYVDYSKVDLTLSEQEKMADVFVAVSRIKQVFEPYKDRIGRYFLGRVNGNFSVELYLYLLDRGEDPKDCEVLFDLIQELSDEVLRERLVRVMTNYTHKNLTGEEFLTYLYGEELRDDYKWNIYWAYTHIREYLAELLALYRELLPLYQPFQQQFEEECDSFAQTLDVEELYRNTDHAIVSMIKETGCATCEVFVTAPLFFVQGYHYDDDLSKGTVYFSLYPRVPLFLERTLGLSLDYQSLTLKVLGDPVRYEILKRITLTDDKSKIIAEDLGISPGNVTFHSQKLLNANLMLFDTEDNSVKYRLNKVLLKQMIHQLEDDFQLNED